jgi:tRNA-dependent cyclodipeptide synthase
MSTYKVIIRNSPGWRSFEACTLGISVTSPNWQDGHFTSILDFAAEHFKTIRIDVTDLLYRHNFMAEGLPPREAEARANALGASWLERHRAIIDVCPVKPEIIRWGHWYEHRDYSEAFDGVSRAYAAGTVLRDAIENDVSGFFQRQGREPTEIERQYSRDYLVEEVAVMILQARELPSLRIYPGEQLACLDVVRRGLVAETPRGLDREQFAKVRFHTRGASAGKELCARQAPCPTVRPPLLRHLHRSPPLSR